jgi:hypothetical protein
MTSTTPPGEAMPREGRGTAAAGEAGNSRPLHWEDATQRLTRGGWFWLVTVRPDGAPHAMPVFAASGAFKASYDWPTVVAGDQLDAEYGAPTSGGPPYNVYEITPAKAFALPTDGETTTPTRWRFTAHR